MPSLADIYQDGSLLFLPMSNSSQISMQGFCLLSFLEMLQLSLVGTCECSRRNEYKNVHPSFVPQTVTAEGCPLYSQGSPEGKSLTVLSQVCVHTFEHCTRHVHREYKAQETAAHLFSVDESTTSFPKPNTPRGKGSGRDRRIS